MPCQWTYRIVRQIDGDSGEEFFGIHEVYFRDGKPVTATVSPVGVGSETQEGIALVLDRMKKALDLPILNLEEIGTEGDGHGTGTHLTQIITEMPDDERAKVESRTRELLNKPSHSAAFGATYQIIAALAGECGRFGDPAVKAALDYFQAASEGDFQDVGKVLPFHIEKDPPVS